MPGFLESKLKQEYGADSKIPYIIENKIGAMKGNKETELGRQMAIKHKTDLRMAISKKLMAGAKPKHPPNALGPADEAEGSGPEEKD